MNLRKLIGATVATVVIGAGTAQAAPGFSTANVNMRTGPDTEFPSVGVIPEGTPVNVRGCLRDESWCDVTWGPNRGWVYSEYLAFSYRGQMTPLPDVGLGGLRVPVVVFRANDYWGRYYVGRPWYAERDRWIAYKPRPRVGWVAPPPGVRRPGWWRSGGYAAPAGMPPPPDRGWRRPSGPPANAGPGPGPGPRGPGAPARVDGGGPPEGPGRAPGPGRADGPSRPAGPSRADGPGRPDGQGRPDAPRRPDERRPNEQGRPEGPR